MKLIRWLVYSNVWVSLVAPSMLWFGAIMLGESLGKELYAFVFSATLFTYNIQRLYKASDYLAPDTLERHKWIWEHRRMLQFITLLAGLSTFVCLFFVPYTYLLWLIPAGLVSALYFIPFFGEKPKQKRLRDVPFLKIGLVAFVWTWISIVGVALMADKPFSQWWGLAAFQFLFCFGLTVPFDIRDAAFDLQEGTKTFVSHWGERGAKLMATACFIIGLLCLAVSPVHGSLFLVLVMYMFVAAFSVWFTSPRRHELYYGFWLDGIFLFQGAVVFAANTLFTI